MEVTGDVTPAGATSPDWVIPSYYPFFAILSIGSSSVGTMTVSGGGTVSNGLGYIGSGSASEGVVTITGAGSTWTNSSALYIGLFGQGTLTVRDGGTVKASSVTLGFSSSGTLNLLGSDALGRGVLETGYVTTSLGIATLNLDGGILRAAGNEGDFLRGFGALTAGAEGIWIDSNGHDIAVGTSTSFAGSSSFNKIGTGTLTLTGDSSGFAGQARIDGGTLELAQGGKLGSSVGFIGTGAADIGAVTVSGTDGSGNASTWASTGALHVGGEGEGTLTVSAGGKVSSAGGYIAANSGSEGRVTVTGTDGSGNASAWTSTSTLYVGNSGKGTLSVEAGGQVSNTAGYIASEAGSEGHATVTGAGSSWTNAGTFVVGLAGKGMLTVSDGGTVSGGTSFIGFSGNSESSATVAGKDGNGNASTWISTGTLYVGYSGTGTLTVEDGGKVSAPQVRLGQDVSGTGTFNLRGTDASGRGVLETGYVAKGSGIATLDLDGGILRAARYESDFLRGFGALTAGAEGVWIDSNGHDIAVGASTSFAGSSSFNKIGSGTLTLTGDSSAFIGTTFVNAGRLDVGRNGSGALGGAITVEAGATLGGTGNLGSAGSTVSIGAGGIHAPGSAQSVLGDYVNRGTLQIGANPTAANKIVAAGAVDIAGATLGLALSPANAASWNVFNGPLTIIDKQSAGAVSGTFGAVTQNLLFLDAFVSYDGGDGNDVTLALNRNNLTFASVGQTRNEIAVGTAIDTLDSTNPVWRAIALANDPSSVRASFNVLSGEIHASARTALIEDSRFIRNAVNDRMRAAFGGVGASRAPVMAYAAPAGSGDGAHAAFDAVDPKKAGDRLVLWAQGFGGWGRTSGDGNAERLSRSTGGFFIGGDAPILDTLFSDNNSRLGMVTGYSRTRFDVKNRASSGTSDNYHLGLYGGTIWDVPRDVLGGDLGFRGGAAYTWHAIDTRRSVAIPGLDDSLTGDTNAATAQAFGEFGYGIRAGRAAFEPFANLAYVNFHMAAFSEKGGAAALNGRASTADTAFTTLGLRASMGLDPSGASLTAKGMLGWRHAFGDVMPEAAMRFAAGGDAFSIAGVPIARDAAVVEAGLDYVLSSRATLGVSYAGQFGGGAADQSFRAKASIVF